MANPNIAALTEFYGGTLAWELTPTQPVFAFEQWSGYNMNNSKFRSGSEGYKHAGDWTAGSPAYIEYDWTIANSFQNRLFIFTAAATDVNGSEGTEIIGTTTAPTYNGTAMTELTGGHNSWTVPYRHQMRIWYMVNPPTGTNSFRFTAADSFTSGNTQRTLGYEFSTFYNVDQTNPFKIQLDGAVDDASILVGGDQVNYNTWSTTTPAAGSEQEMKFTASPGDLVLAWIQHEDNVTFNNPAVNYLTDSTGASWTRHNYHDSASKEWQSVHMSVPSTASTGQVNLKWKPNSFNSSGSAYSYIRPRGATLAAAGATNLFTVPTGYTVKVNQMYAGSTTPGLAMTAQVKGLPASGASPSTLRNASNNADLITAVDNDAVANIASGVTITPGQQTTLLTDPIFLTEGNILAAMVGFGEGYMKSASEMKPAPTATIAVSMEIIKG